MSFYNISKSKECKVIQSQINNYSPVLAKFIDFIFMKNKIDNPDKILKWIILIIGRLKNKDDRPLINYEKVIINKNFVLENYLRDNKELLSFKQQSDIFRLFKVINDKFNVHWILWDFSEALSNPILFIAIFPTIYKLYIGKKQNNVSKAPLNNDQINNQQNIIESPENLFYKKSRFEMVIDRYLPLLQITNDYFKEKLVFFSFLMDQIINIVLSEFSELITIHLPLILTDFSEKSDKQLNSQYSRRKILRKIGNSISIFDHDLGIISNFFKIEIYQKITEIRRQLILFNLFTKKYQKLQKSLKINVNDIKRNESNAQYIIFIKKIINVINNFKETLLISLMKLFSKEFCPDLHFPMLNFIIKNSNFSSEIFTFSDPLKRIKEKMSEIDESSECCMQNDPLTEKNIEKETQNNKSLVIEKSEMKSTEIESLNNKSSETESLNNKSSEIESLNNKSSEIESLNNKSSETETLIVKNSESNTSNKNNSNDQKLNDILVQEISQTIHLSRLKNHFSFTKLCFTLSEQGLDDHNDILSLMQVTSKCKRVFSALSVQKILRIASSNAILSRTAIWCFSPTKTNPQGFPDRMFGSPGVVTVVVFFIMRAFEFLIISCIPNKYRVKQRLTMDTILALYRRAKQSLANISESESRDKNENQQNDNENKNENDDNANINNDNESKIENDDNTNINNDNENQQNDNESKIENDDNANINNDNENETESKIENDDNANINNVIENKSEKNENKQNDCENKSENNDNANTNHKNINKNIENDKNYTENDITNFNSVNEYEIPEIHPHSTNSTYNDTFQENDEDADNCDNSNLSKLFMKRGFTMIKESIEIGLATMHLFTLENSPVLFGDEIEPSNLFLLLEQMKNNTNKEPEENSKTKKLTDSKLSRNLATRKRGNVVIEMVNIGFAILNKTRFKTAMSIFFKTILNELTKIPVQKFDIKIMCANFEPDFPLRKEASPLMKNIFLKVQDESIAKKLAEIEALNKTKVMNSNKSNVVQKKNTNNSVSNSLKKDQITLNKKPEIKNKKVDAND